MWPHLWCDTHTSFKVKRSNVKVTRPINADTDRAPYLPNGKVYKIKTLYTDGGRRPASATGAMTSKVKAKGRKVTWSVWAVLAQCCTCVIRGWQGHTVSAEPGGHTSCYITKQQPFKAPFFSRTSWVNRCPKKTRHFWIFNSPGWLLELLALASHCVTASWLAAAIQIRAREPNVLS